MGATHSISISDMTVEQIQQLTPEQLQSLNKRQIEKLTDDQSDEVILRLFHLVCDSIDSYIVPDTNEKEKQSLLDDIKKLLNLFFYINGLRYTNIDATATVINNIIRHIPHSKENIDLLVLLRNKILQPGKDRGNVALLGTYGQAERVQNIIESITDDPDHTGSGYNKVYTSTKHRRRTTKRKSRKRVTKKKPRKRRKKYRSLSK